MLTGDSQFPFLFVWNAYGIVSAGLKLMLKGVFEPYNPHTIRPSIQNQTSLYLPVEYGDGIVIEIIPLRTFLVWVQGTSGLQFGIEELLHFFLDEVIVLVQRPVGILMRRVTAPFQRVQFVADVQGIKMLMDS